MIIYQLTGTEIDVFSRRPARFDITITTPFGNVAQGSRSRINFEVALDILQNLATARGVVLTQPGGNPADLFDILFESIQEHVQNAFAQPIDIPPKRLP